jgi:prophage DNA circulation protein
MCKDCQREYNKRRRAASRESSNASSSVASERDAYMSSLDMNIHIIADKVHELNELHSNLANRVDRLTAENHEKIDVINNTLIAVCKQQADKYCNLSDRVDTLYAECRDKIGVTTDMLTEVKAQHTEQHSNLANKVDVLTANAEKTTTLTGTLTNNVSAHTQHIAALKASITRCTWLLVLSVTACILFRVTK